MCKLNKVYAHTASESHKERKKGGRKGGRERGGEKKKEGKEQVSASLGQVFSLPFTVHLLSVI